MRVLSSLLVLLLVSPLVIEATLLVAQETTTAAPLAPVCEELVNFTVTDADVPRQTPQPCLSAGACCDLCAGIAGCAASVFNGSVCSFKSGTTAAYAAGLTAVFRVLPPTPPPSPAPVGPAGTLIWRYETSGQIESKPVVSSDNIVYVGSVDSTMYALDARDGVQLWNF